VNQAGQVVGWMGTSISSDAHAFIWEQGQVTDLGPIPGGFTSEARAINGLQEVVGVGRITDPGSGKLAVRAFFWAQGTMMNLGTLPGQLLSAARDLNDAGLVVGTAWEGGLGQTGFVWYDGDMVDLNTLIPPEGGVSVKIPYGINNAGQIACYGNDQENDVVTVLLTPVESPPGDLTCDGSISVDDFWLLLDAWGPCPADGGCPADLNGNGTVNVVDFLILLANWTG
jgi:probable HAF family extracellular repeat protein